MVKEQESAPTPLSIRVGDKVKLRDYTQYSDHRRHIGQIATVMITRYDVGHIVLKWKDNATSTIYADCNNYSGVYSVYSKKVDDKYQALYDQIRKDVENET